MSISACRLQPGTCSGMCDASRAEPCAQGAKAFCAADEFEGCSWQCPDSSDPIGQESYNCSKDGISCDQEPPPCDIEQVPSVDEAGTCYTGECVSAALCNDCLGGCDPSTIEPCAQGGKATCARNSSGQCRWTCGGGEPIGFESVNCDVALITCMQAPPSCGSDVPQVNEDGSCYTGSCVSSTACR